MIERLKKWSHDTLGWGYSSGSYRNGNSTCEYCGEELLTDSNGDLFHFVRPAIIDNLQAQAAEPDYWIAVEYPPYSIETNLIATTKEAAQKLEAIGFKMLPVFATPQSSAPIDMILHCPSCGKQHIDAPCEQGEEHYQEAWANPPHRSHLCHDCGHIWRPADVCTNGVATIKTKGKADSPQPSAPAVPEGWQLVPKEATPEMLAAANKANDKSYVENYGKAELPENLYLAMLQSAPQAQDTEVKK